MLIAGVLAALFERSRSGKGQVIDAAMVEGASMLAAPILAFMAAGLWSDTRGANLLDSGAPFYDTYETADGKHVAVGCLEPHFFAEFARLLPLGENFVRGQYDRALWQDMRAAIADADPAEDARRVGAMFAATDACVAPVLSLAEAQGSSAQSGASTHCEDGSARSARRRRHASRPHSRRLRPCRTMTTSGRRPCSERSAFRTAEIKALVKSGLIGQ